MREDRPDLWAMGRYSFHLAMMHMHFEIPKKNQAAKAAIVTKLPTTKPNNQPPPYLRVT